MADVKYEDEKLLTSDEFIKTAKENADKNLQIQKDTAQKVFDSTYASLERQYDEAATAAGVAKQRNLIDADTAYQRQELKYGAEQEALASAGLSGSGMNEYRRAQSYQQNRADRQMSYAEYDRALREAAYTRDQGKLAADLNKTQTEANAELQYNDTMTNIAEKELGYAELERQEISTAYGSYINGINDGSMTLDQIKADASWAKLSPEQQASVEKTAKIKGIKTKIDNGESWEDIQSSYAYLELDDDGRNQVDGYHAQVEAGKTKDANAALGSYLEMANAGWSIDDIVAAAIGNGHYDILTESGDWQSVANAVSSYAEDKAAAETVTNINNAIANGATLEEIQDMEGYDDLDDTTKTEIAGAVENRDERMEATVDYIMEEVNSTVDKEGNATITSLSALNSFLNSYTDAEGNLLSKDMKEKVVTKWQENNVKDIASVISDAKFENGKLMLDGEEIDGAFIAAEIKNGVYGERGDEIKNMFVVKVTSSIKDLSWTLAQLNALGVDASRLESKTTVRKNIEKKHLSNGNEEIYAMEFESGGKVTDQATLEYLNGLSTDTRTFVRVGDDYFYKISSLSTGWVRYTKVSPATSGAGANSTNSASNSTNSNLRSSSGKR